MYVDIFFKYTYHTDDMKLISSQKLRLLMALWIPFVSFMYDTARVQRLYFYLCEREGRYENRKVKEIVFEV